MYKIFLSSPYRDLEEYRSKIFEELNDEFEIIGVENIIPDGSHSHKLDIKNLKKSDIIIFLISPYYGSLIANCKLKQDCKADCPMKTEEGHISYLHCEYKTTVAEKKPHFTYIIEEGWDAPDVKREAVQFIHEIQDEEFTHFLKNIEDPNSVKMIKEHLKKNILNWQNEGLLVKKEFIKSVEDIQIEEEPISDKNRITDLPKDKKALKLGHDVFICHSSKDKIVADTTCHFLEENGIKCWIAPRDVSSGSYAASIVKAIKNAKLIVLIFTNDANFSKHVKRELEQAVKNGITIQPFRTEDVEPTEEIDFYISSMHWLDALTPPLEDHLIKRVKMISQ